MAKILVVATSDIHLQVFHLPYFEYLKSRGHSLDIAVEIRGNGIVPFTDKIFNLPFKRTLFTLQLFTAFRELKKIINDGQYDLIHCHTPIPSALTRLAARKFRKNGLKVLYTCHGFHFYRNAPLFNWLVYYPVEKMLSASTDGIITINREDFDIATRDFDARETYYMRGIGVDTGKFSMNSGKSKAELRQEMGYEATDFVLLYTANFIRRKNHQFILKALKELRVLIPTIKVLFAGSGVLLESMKDFVQRSGLNENVEFLGFRNDVNKFLAISDISISASRHEGLGLALTEAMFMGVPVVASEDRGHRELIDNGVNGFLFEQGNQQHFIDCIMQLYKDNALRKTFAERSIEKVKIFSIENSLAFMDSVYSNYLETGSNASKN